MYMTVCIPTAFGKRSVNTNYSILSIFCWIHLFSTIAKHIFLNRAHFPQQIIEEENGSSDEEGEHKFVYVTLSTNSKDRGLNFITREYLL